MVSDRSAAGRAVYARNLGLDEAGAERVLTDRVGPTFTAEVLEAAGGPGWHSPALTDRDRSIAVVAALVCQGVTDDRLMTYVSLARRQGVDDDGLTALLVLLTAYVGQPRTSLAMAAIHRSAEEGAGPGPEGDRGRGGLVGQGLG